MTHQSITDQVSGTTVPGRLRAVLAEVSATGVDGLTEVELLEVVALLEMTKGAAAAAQARATARFVEERDARVAEMAAAEEISRREASLRRRATRSEVALARRCSPGQADRHVGAARALVHELPGTMAALTAGEISEWRATIVVRETACLSPERRREADRRLAGGLRDLGDRALAAAAHRACVDLDQESVVERRRRAAASRHVSVRPAPDGMAWLSILGPLVDVVGAHVALRAAEQARHVATGDPEADAAAAADERGRGAWMTDTALEMLSGRAPGQAQPVEIGLVMSEGVLLPGERSGGGADEVEVPGHGALAGDLAREHVLRLLDEGDERDGETALWLRRLWTAPDGRDLVAVDSRQRLFAGRLRRLIELRDATCRVPWCDAPVRQVDHVRRVSRGGETSASNGMGVCQRHNLDKEAPGWRAEVISTGLDPGGGPHEVRLTTPAGGDVRCLAPPLLGPGRAERRPVVEQPSALEARLLALLDAA
ncbi:DUF222 domain-containing protein [Janibacter indicus]|uniref:DUF222 domain-containing protein n=1 Tax=Janibacter indicus TaxID=857417 RepID=A0A7L9J2L1_9MICO|nr:HNH endonuclease signature motif containing protein [Janibacter indicus]QOK23245.1 DUF222 domain-containing protein [Janibacter indicus]